MKKTFDHPHPWSTVFTALGFLALEASGAALITAAAARLPLAQRAPAEAWGKGSVELLLAVLLLRRRHKGGGPSFGPRASAVVRRSWVVLLYALGQLLVNGRAAEGRLADGLASRIYLAAAVGLAEEALWRGTVFEQFRSAWGQEAAGTRKAAAASSLLFGAAHLLNLPAAGGTAAAVVFQAGAVVILGGELCLIYADTGSLAAVAALHGLIDAAALIWQYDGTGPALAGGMLVQLILLVPLILDGRRRWHRRTP